MASEIQQEKHDLSDLANERSMDWKGRACRTMQSSLCFSLYPLTGRGTSKVHSMEPVKSQTNRYHTPILHPLDIQPCKCQWEKKGEKEEVRGGREEAPGHMPAKAKPWRSSTHLLPGLSLLHPPELISVSSGHYFGHWHVRMLLFGLFNCLSQRAYPGKSQEGRDKEVEHAWSEQGGSSWARSIYTTHKWSTTTAKGLILLCAGKLILKTDYRLD